MTTPHLLIIGAVTDRMMTRIDGHFVSHHLSEIDDFDAFLAQIGPSVLAVLTNGHDGLKPQIIDALPNLKIISCYGVGYDAIDATAAAARGIVVSHTPDVLNNEVANTAIMLWLAVSRDLLANDAHVRSGAWERDGNAPLTRSVQNRTVGILGMGRIGQTIAEKLAIFDARILYHTRTPKDVPYTHVSDLTDMAAQSDVLIVITPGGAATRHLVNEQVIRALGPSGILINVARGSVVDETALVGALQSGQLGGAGLDVFEHEPKVPTALTRMQNVVLLPHVGSGTIETRAAMGDLTCDNLLHFLDSGAAVTPVPECQHL